MTRADWAVVDHVYLAVWATVFVVGVVGSVVRSAGVMEGRWERRAGDADELWELWLLPAIVGLLWPMALVAGVGWCAMVGSIGLARYPFRRQAIQARRVTDADARRKAAPTLLVGQLRDRLEQLDKADPDYLESRDRLRRMIADLAVIHAQDAADAQAIVRGAR